MTDIFPKEDIPNESFLFYRVHKNDYVDGQIIPGAFKSRGDGMSTDWDKYITSLDSLMLAKDPSKNAIIKFSAGVIRSESSMSVEHDPIETNRAHSLIIGIPEKGDLKVKVRVLLKRLFEWEINFKDN